MTNNLVFQNPYWWFLAATLLAIAYAVFLYAGKKESVLSKKIKVVLAIIRGVGVFLILLLLLKPLLRSNEAVTLKPIVVLGVDNSKSIGTISKTAQEAILDIVRNSSNFLNSDKYDIEIRDLGGITPDDSISFSGKSTNIGKFLTDTREEFVGQNLAHVVLISDGISNAGYTPMSQPLGFPLHTLGVGDTTKKKDIALKSVTANKLAFLGNDFPVKIALQSNLYKGSRTTVRVKLKGEVVTEEIVTFNSDFDYQELTFSIAAKEPGIQQYQIEVLPLSGEYTTINNRRNVLVEIVDGKEKVLILALNPHADLKALRSILAQNELLETSIRNLQTSTNEEIMKEEFDILILHQIPDQLGLSTTMLPKLLAKGKPVFFILGEQSDISKFNGMQEVLGINASSFKMDKVTGSLNPSFQRFKLNEGLSDLLESLPPISAPFGDYKLFPGSKAILLQKVGSLQTERPLLVINSTKTRKAAVLAAEGLWKWRLEEYSQNNSQVLVDELISKSIQLLSVKEDKNKLRVYPTQTIFDINEKARLQSEAYNPLLERIFNISVEMVINGPGSFQKTLNYDIIEGSPVLEVDGLPEGVYSYTATAEVLGNKEVVKGQFVVNDVDLESYNTTADFNFLRTLSKNSGGTFAPLSSSQLIYDEINDTDAVGKVFNTESLKELINLKWILPLIILLFAIEWILRKYKGTY